MAENKKTLAADLRQKKPYKHTINKNLKLPLKIAIFRGNYENVNVAVSSVVCGKNVRYFAKCYFCYEAFVQPRL